MRVPTLRLTPVDRSEWLLPGGFTLAIVLTVGVGVSLEALTAGDVTLPPVVYQPILFPGMFTVAPLCLAAVNTLRGGSLLCSASVGVVPGVAFLLLAWATAFLGGGSTGDAPASALAVVFATVGLGHAVVGITVGIAGVAVLTTDEHD
jgi:hypothetical protein